MRWRRSKVTHLCAEQVQAEHDHRPVRELNRGADGKLRGAATRRVDGHEDVVGVLVVLKVDVPPNVADARAVEEGVDEVRGKGLVRAVGREAHRFAEQHRRVVSKDALHNLHFV